MELAEQPLGRRGARLRAVCPKGELTDATGRDGEWRAVAACQRERRVGGSSTRVQRHDRVTWAVVLLDTTLPRVNSLAERASSSISTLTQPRERAGLGVDGDEASLREAERER